MSIPSKIWQVVCHEQTAGFTPIVTVNMGFFLSESEAKRFISAQEDIDKDMSFTLVSYRDKCDILAQITTRYTIHLLARREYPEGVEFCAIPCEDSALEGGVDVPYLFFANGKPFSEIW